MSAFLTGWLIGAVGTLAMFVLAAPGVVGTCMLLDRDRWVGAIAFIFGYVVIVVVPVCILATQVLS